IASVVSKRCSTRTAWRSRRSRAAFASRRRAWLLARRLLALTVTPLPPAAAVPATVAVPPAPIATVKTMARRRPPPFPFALYPGRRRPSSSVHQKSGLSAMITPRLSGRQHMTGITRSCGRIAEADSISVTFPEPRHADGSALHLRQPAGEEAAFGGRLRQRQRLPVLLGRFLPPALAAEQVGAGGGHHPVARQLVADLVDEGRPGRGPVRHRDGDGAVE